MLLILASEAKEGVVVGEACRAKGVEVRFVATVEALMVEVARKRPAEVLVDVTDFALDGLAAVEALKRDPATRGIPVVAFGDSLRADLLQDAREAGAERVLPRAAFHKQLEAIFGGRRTIRGGKLSACKSPNKGVKYPGFTIGALRMDDPSSGGPISVSPHPNTGSVQSNQPRR